jgi:hypothetical protein
VLDGPAGARKNGGSMMLGWSQAAVLAGFLAGFGVLVRPGGRHGLVVVTAVCRETSLVLALFSLWQLAGRVSLLRLGAARGHGLWIWHVERALHFPSEVAPPR